jgi:hypothetical protein
MSDFKTLLQGFRAYLASRGDAVVERFLEGFDWQMEARALEPRSLPVVDYLSDVAAPVDDRDNTLLSELIGYSALLHWAQTYSTGDFGDAFLKRYGWVELFGTRGHFSSDVMAGGFLMLGPEIHYPDHHHVAEEIYIPLTDGSLWSKDGGAFQPRRAGEIIHHPSDVSHAMQTEQETLLALYLWRGGPLAQKSIISGRNI